MNVVTNLEIYQAAARMQQYNYHICLDKFRRIGSKMFNNDIQLSEIKRKSQVFVRPIKAKKKKNIVNRKYITNDIILRIPPVVLQ